MLYKRPNFKGLKYLIAALQQVAEQKFTAAQLRGHNDYTKSIRQPPKAMRVENEDSQETGVTLLRSIN